MAKVTIKQNKEKHSVKAEDFILIALDKDNDALVIEAAGDEDTVYAIYVQAGKELIKHAANNL